MIKEAWEHIEDIRDNKPDDYAELSTLLNTCKPLATKDDMNNLYNHFVNGYSYMAMTDYPYETDFLQPMPANPVNAACVPFKDVPVNPTAGEDKD